MKDDTMNRFRQDMAMFLPLVSSGLEPLGAYGKDVLAIAGECRELIDALNDEAGMESDVLENRLKMVSAQIDKTIQVLGQAHAGVYKTMASIGNKKRLKKAYE